MNKFQFIAVAFFLWGVIFSSKNATAQNDTIPPVIRETAVDTTGGVPRDAIGQDTSGNKKKKWSRPKKALVWALVLPGAGQAYNHRYWKMPILYAGIGACAYFWITNQVGYSEFKKAYDRNYTAQQADPTYVIYEDNLKHGTLQVYTSLAQLSSDKNTYRRYRDLSIAASVALYGISILDAYVDAHLREFDLSPDLSFSVKPLFYNYNNATFAPGLSLVLKVKNNRTHYNQLYRGSFLQEE